MTRTLLAVVLLSCPVAGFAADSILSQTNVTSASEVTPRTRVRKAFDARQVCQSNCNTAFVAAEATCKGMSATAYSACMKTAGDRSKACKALCPTDGSNATPIQQSTPMGQ